MKHKIPFVIILNGTSSVGKSSIQKKLLEHFKNENVIPLKVDDYVDMLPRHLVGMTSKAALGFQFYQPEKDKYDIRVGRLGNLIIHQLHSDAKKLLLSGSSLILDHVILTKAWANEIEDLDSTGAQIFKFLITCGIQELSKREKLRGDRLIGLASGLKYVEKNIKKYDLIVNTSLLNPVEASNNILNYFLGQV